MSVFALIRTREPYGPSDFRYTEEVCAGIVQPAARIDRPKLGGRCADLALPS